VGCCVSCLSRHQLQSHLHGTHGSCCTHLGLACSSSWATLGCAEGWGSCKVVCWIAAPARQQQVEGSQGPAQLAAGGNWQQLLHNPCLLPSTAVKPEQQTHTAPTGTTAVACCTNTSYVVLPQLVTLVTAAACTGHACNRPCYSSMSLNSLRCLRMP
jgi:hypothetical protein